MRCQRIHCTKARGPVSNYTSRAGKPCRYRRSLIGIALHEFISLKIKHHVMGDTLVRNENNLDGQLRIVFQCILLGNETPVRR